MQARDHRPCGKRRLVGLAAPPSPLDKIQPDHWLPEYTTDLLDLLNVLGRLVALEPAQAGLLARVCDGKLITVDDIRAAGVLAAAPTEPDGTMDSDDA